MLSLTRSELVEKLRDKLRAQCDEEHSICEVAAQKGIFCHGFAQWTFTELKRRHPTIVRSRPAITPAEMLELANRWQVARQTARETPFACDLQLHEGSLRICKGWDEWSSEDLARFYKELTGEEVKVVPAA